MNFTDENLRLCRSRLREVSCIDSEYLNVLASAYNFLDLKSDALKKNFTNFYPLPMRQGVPICEPIKVLLP